MIALDSGGYGAASINNAISIVAAPGVYAGVSVLSGTGITINAPSANVTLRGLSIIGLGGTTGIQLSTVGALHVENVLVSGLTGDGMLVFYAAAFLVRDSVFRANGYGIDIVNSASLIVGFAERTRFDENTTGIVFGDLTQLDVSDSTFFNNGTAVVVQPVTAFASIAVDQCFFNRSTRGIDLEPGATGNASAIVGRTTFSHVTDPLHRNTNTTGTFTFANNQVSNYSYTPVFDTALPLR